MKLFRRPWFWCIWVVLILLSLVWAAYRFAWSGIGFQGKTVWDWLSLLIIPVALALVALSFNQVNTRTERQIALDKQREDLLQTYLDRMSELLLEKGLRTSQPDEVRNVARVRTINILTQLDAKRVGYVFAFLREAKLLDLSNPVVSLKGTDFTDINWSGADLSFTNLSETNLRGANLSYADFYGANLSQSELWDADLSSASFYAANLNNAKLSRSNLSQSIFYKANLQKAILIFTNLSGATLSEADLSGTSLIGANLRKAFLGKTTFIDGVQIGKASISHKIIFKEANLSQAILVNAHIDKNRLTPEQISQAIWD